MKALQQVTQEAGSSESTGVLKGRETLLVLWLKKTPETSKPGKNVSLVSVLGPSPEQVGPLCSLLSTPPPRSVDAFLPRFSITGTYDLKKTLSYLGITKIFEEQGDLTRIVPNRSLKVGKVSRLGLGIASCGTGSLRTARARATAARLYQPGVHPPAGRVRIQPCPCQPCAPG